MALFTPRNSRVKGLDNVLRNINREIGMIEGRTVGGMVKALAFLRNQTEKTVPKTPLDLGNLRASWFVSTSHSTPVGKGTAKFRDNPKARLTAAQLIADHQKTTADAIQELKAKENRNAKFVMGGYSANYAMQVHENPRLKFRRPGAEWKWLQKQLVANSDTMVQIIRDNAKINKP